MVVVVFGGRKRGKWWVLGGGQWQGWWVNVVGVGGDSGDRCDGSDAVVMMVVGTVERSG